MVRTTEKQLKGIHMTDKPSKKKLLKAENRELRASIAQLTIERDEAISMLYRRTGLKDKDGREILVGDRIRILLNDKHTKPEYWNPEYEVYFDPPRYTLRHIGGGKDSDTARFRFRSFGKFMVANVELETITD